MKFRSFSDTKYLWLVIVLLSIIAILFKSIYREYIYSNEINDFGIADSSPNFFCKTYYHTFLLCSVSESILKGVCFICGNWSYWI